LEALIDAPHVHNVSFIPPLPDKEVEKVATSAWDRHSTGNNWVGGPARAVATADELDAYPPAGRSGMMPRNHTTSQNQNGRAWDRGATAELERQHLRPNPAANAPPENSEDALALAFANQHADSLRYVAEWNRWFEWDGMRWRRDRTEIAFDLSRQICRDAAGKANASDRKRIASAATVAAVARLARADRLIAATVEEWDRDPDLLNTPIGLVHLPTGEIWQHDPGLKMTKITAVEPDHR
jgi:hypothetical protein